MSSPQGHPAAAAPSRKGGANRLVLGAGVVALALGGAVAFQRSGERSTGNEPEKERVVVDPGVVELEPFILNLPDPAGDRYFRLKLSVVLDQRAIAERAGVGLAQAKLRDAMLSILSKKRAAQMTTVEGKDLLRAELLAAAEALFAAAPFHEAESDPAPARVLDVYFTEFLVQ